MLEIELREIIRIMRKVSFSLTISPFLRGYLGLKIENRRKNYFTFDLLLTQKPPIQISEPSFLSALPFQFTTISISFSAVFSFGILVFDVWFLVYPCPTHTKCLKGNILYVIIKNKFCFCYV